MSRNHLAEQMELITTLRDALHEAAADIPAESFPDVKALALMLEQALSLALAKIGERESAMYSYRLPGPPGPAFASPEELKARGFTEISPGVFQLPSRSFGA